jgi:hypothetical protein
VIVTIIYNFSVDSKEIVIFCLSLLLVQVRFLIGGVMETVAVSVRVVR